MYLKNALLFLLVPGFLSSGSVLLISFLCTWLLNVANVEVNEGITTGWIPALLGIAAYFLLVHHRLKLFLNKWSENNYVFILLAIVFMVFPAVVFQVAYKNLKMTQTEIQDLREINPVAKNTVWKFTGSLPQATMLYLGDFQEYTSGKHPKVDFLCYGLVHFEQENLWILFSESEMIDTDESEAEKGIVFDKVHQECVSEVNSILNSKAGNKYLVPLGQSEDLEYAYKTLHDVNYKGKVPERIFTLESTFQKGIKKVHLWFLIISVFLNLLYFFIICLSKGNLNVHAYNQTGTIDLSVFIQLFQYIREAPVTAILLGLTLLFLFIELAHDPNIFTVKEDPYVFRWAVSNDVLKTGEWYRLFTYPFVNIYLLLRIMDVSIFAMIGYSIEKHTSSPGFGLLSLSIVLAGGLAAIFLDSSVNCGLTVFSFGYSAYYLFTGFQRQIGFSSWKFMGIAFLVFALLIGSLSEFLEYPKLIAATLTGFVFGPFLRYKETT